MKNTKLKYKGFIGTAQHSAYDNLFYGRLLNTTDLVSYDGKNLKELNKDFILAVEDYIEICAEYNKLFTEKMFLESRIYILIAMVKKYINKFKNAKNIKIFKINKEWGHATYNKETKMWHGKYHKNNEKIKFKTFSNLKNKAKQVASLNFNKKYITLPRRRNENE